MGLEAGGSDEVLAQRASKDSEAFAELVRRYADRIFNLAYRMIGNRSEAEDLAQEVFLRTYRGLAGFRSGNAFGAWIYRIAVNVCLTYRSRAAERVSEPLSEQSPVVDATASVAELAERRDVQQAVQQAILSLPPMYRAAVILYHIEGRPYNEIADLLDLPVNTVRTHLHRGRALLREYLTGRGLQEGI
jgi:RNA polymerase sigma-70 factor (ECF subfamily)